MDHSVLVQGIAKYRESSTWAYFAKRSRSCACDLEQTHPRWEELQSYSCRSRVDGVWGA